MPKGSSLITNFCEFQGKLGRVVRQHSCRETPCPDVAVAGSVTKWNYPRHQPQLKWSQSREVRSYGGQVDRSAITSDVGLVW